MISVKNLYKSYGDTCVFSDYSEEIPLGKRTCIWGPSGIGKTTLFRLLMDLEQVDSGEISGLENLKQSVVFQEDHLCPTVTVEGNILLPHMKKNSPLTLAQVSEALGILGLEACKEKRAEELSGGMRRRVAILRAVLATFDILFLDEPFKGLDEKSKKITMDYVMEKTKNKTVLWITHDPEELSYFHSEKVLHLS
ncbi:MAG: ATP-binding cassette domain-containing protein [Eubacteriales bacterium]